MPLFNEASRIYDSVEVNFMRSCFTHTVIILEESDQNYSATELAAYIMRLYASGLRDHSYLCELAADLAHQRYQTRHNIEPYPSANSNGAVERHLRHEVVYDPLG